MSLTAVSPLLTDWMTRGLEWRYFWRPVVRPFTIPANGQIQVPSEGYTFKASEGTLLTFGAIFDHPTCGIRLECHPELDTADSFTVNLISLVGMVNQPWGVFANIPPQTAPGVYQITNYKEWIFEEWMRLYLINTDSIDHRCIGYSYTVALLREERTEEGK